MNEYVSTAVQSLAALVHVLCLLAVVYVLREVMLIVRELRTLRQPGKAEPMETQTAEPVQPSIPVKELGESGTIAPVHPCARAESVVAVLPAAPLQPPICGTCKAKVKKIVSSTIVDGKTLLTFKCGRCTKETNVPEELVPPELLGPAQ